MVGPDAYREPAKEPPARELLDEAARYSSPPAAATIAGRAERASTPSARSSSMTRRPRDDADAFTPLPISELET